VRGVCWVIALLWADIQKGGGPGRAEKHIDFHAQQVRTARAAFAKRHGGGTTPVTVLVGKSMGSRVGCHVAVAQPGLVDAVVCLGYPLVGQNGKRRDQVLLQLTTPTLLVQVRCALMSRVVEHARVRVCRARCGGVRSTTQQRLSSPCCRELVIG